MATVRNTKATGMGYTEEMEKLGVAGDLVVIPLVSCDPIDGGADKRRGPPLVVQTMEHVLAENKFQELLRCALEVLELLHQSHQRVWEPLVPSSVRAIEAEAEGLACQWCCVLPGCGKRG